MMKIDAPRAYAWVEEDGAWHASPSRYGSSDEIPARIVRESDWRKIMAVVRAANELVGDGTADWGDDELNAVFGRTLQLRKHLEKRK